MLLRRRDAIALPRRLRAAIAPPAIADDTADAMPRDDAVAAAVITFDASERLYAMMLADAPALPMMRDAIHFDIFRFRKECLLDCAGVSRHHATCH